MKRYRGTMSRTLNWEATVSAENADEAKDKIDKMISAGKFTEDNAQIGYIEIHDIEETDEAHPVHKCISCGEIISESKQNACYFCDTMEVDAEPIFCKTQCVFDYYGIGLIAVAELSE